MREIVVAPTETAKKLENFLKKEFPIGYVRKILRKKGVRINGKRASGEDAVQPGDHVQLYIPFQRMQPVQREKTVALSAVYEDDSLLVIDKPAGLAVHEGKTVGRLESVLGILQRRYRSTGIKPRLVHRLDKETSGVLLIAKDAEAERELLARFEAGSITKEYVCLVAGRLPADRGKIEFPLPGRAGTPVRAVTHYRVAKRFSDTTLVRVSTETGRLHQIRLHFAQLGYPVVLDVQHGDFSFNKRFRRRYGLGRQFLHAAKLAVVYRGTQREWTAPLARDLDDVLRQLARD
jgi:23S rRNA pseudouridine955/2504/2580 synthase